MKGGAVNFLAKPIDEAAPLASIAEALEQDRRLRSVAFERESLLTRYRLLTTPEQQVLPLLVSGLLKASGPGIRNHVEYRADTPWAYHAENGSRFFRNSGMARQ
jgi:hypothetical protein